MKSFAGLSRLRRRLFTLTELMLALAIASLVFAMLYGMLNQPMALWRDALAQWHLVAQTRLVREKMLRGISGRYGLREAINDTISIQPGKTENVEWIYFDVETDPPNIEDDSKNPRCLILVNPGQDLGTRTVPEDGKIETLTRPEVNCTEMDFTHTYGRIQATYTFNVTSGNKTYVQKGTLITGLSNF